MINSYFNRLFARLKIIFTSLMLISTMNAKPLYNFSLQPYTVALWIAHHLANPNAHGVFHFRKQINLDNKHGTFVIHISADQHYLFFVNGQAVSFGPVAESPEPTRSDCYAWSASPGCDLLTTDCGISSTSPGFASSQIKPVLVNLGFCETSRPHPMGMNTRRIPATAKEKMGYFN